MPTWVFGVDSSFDQLTRDEARRLKQNGCKLYVQALTALPPSGLMQPTSRVISLRNASLEGLAIAGYAMLPATDPIGAMNLARSGVPDDLWGRLKFVAVDVEVNSTFGNAVTAVNRMHALNNKLKVVYTNYNSWVTYMGNNAVPADWHLWNAYWDGDPDVDFTRLPFGNFKPENVIGEQWSGGTHVHGQYVDRNTFNAEKLGLLPPPPEPLPPEPGPLPKPTLSEARVAADLIRDYLN